MENIINFVAVKGGKKYAIQVCYQLDILNQKREMHILSKLSKEFAPILISFEDNTEVKMYKGKEIYVINILDLLLKRVRMNKIGK